VDEVRRAVSGSTIQRWDARRAEEPSSARMPWPGVRRRRTSTTAASASRSTSVT
jgi:hypothetical protein